jgi:hypothetical protein
MSKKEISVPIQMQWKEDKLDIHNKFAKIIEPASFRDSLIPSKGHTDVTRTGQVLSHDLEQGMYAKEVNTIQVNRTSRRQNKSFIARSKDFYGRCKFKQIKVFKE